MSFWCLQFPPKKRTQVKLRFHSSKVEFVCLFFGGNVSLKKSFRPVQPNHPKSIKFAPNWAPFFFWIIFGRYFFGYCWCALYFFWVISNWKYDNVILEWLYWAKMAFSTKPCLIYNVHCCNSKTELKANQVNGRHSDRNPHCKYTPL